MDIRGQVALVTGAGSGLGAATARGFAARGARVIVMDRDGDAAKTVASDVGVAAACDVSDADAVAEALAAAIEEVGTPRIVVNCAGIAPAARVVSRDGTLSIDTFEAVLRVNLLGSYTVMSHAARAMGSLAPLETGERGVIINTASVAYQDGQVGQTAYSASKGAIAALTLPAAREMARQGIRVMAIAPGLFRTPMMESLPEDVTDKITANIPFPARLGMAEEYALLAAQIVENPYLNGEVIRLDGAVRLPQK